jgi:hypothetical protein
MTRLGRGILFSCLCTVLPFIAWGAEEDSSPDIVKSMTAEQYRAAGLHKLNARELEALDTWLREYTTRSQQPLLNSTSVRTGDSEAANAPAADVPPGEKPPPAAVDDTFGFPYPPPVRAEEAEELHASVLPPFRGWNGKTVFRLDNGQVWRQRNAGQFTYSGDDTRVVISKNSWGFYELRLLGADRSVGVSRVK